MGRILILAGCLALLVVGTAASGASCAACTLLVALLQQMALHHRTDVKGAVNVFCASVAPSDKTAAAICTGLLDLVAPAVQVDFEKRLQPELTCGHLLGGMCKDEFQQCRLFTKWPPAPYTSVAPAPESRDFRPSFRTVSSAEAAEALKRKLAELELAGKSESPFFDTLHALLGGGIGKGKHRPLFDDDGDAHSTFPYLRGSQWRGQDCDDKNPDVYPGRALDTVGPAKDHNCNGIYGLDPTGASYEDKLCKNMGQRGLIVLGDSATAHFSIPPEWVTPSAITNGTYSNFLTTALNELDFPACGAWTAHLNPKDCPPTAGLPLKSFYTMMRERNRCNHRDFANIGVNGASTRNMKPPTGVISALKPRNGTDHPATVFYSLIGNDVCNHRASFDAMTTPEAFEENVLSALDYLDERLPPRSFVVFVGLVDGRVLFDTMAHLTHPIGTSYANLYDYLNCLDTSPCWGWMTTNATVRNATTARAMQLNQVYGKIIRERQGTYRNFKMHYLFADMATEITKWVAKGGKASDLIEKVDGFHPSTIGNMLIADTLWTRMLNELPEALGPINPNNAMIQQLFGDQGGH